MTGLGKQANWHKDLITWALAGALVVTALAVGGAYWKATRHKEKPVALPENVPTDIHQQLSGYTVTHSDGSRRVYTVHAARTISFKQGGATVLDDVMVELFGKAGKRRDVLRTQQCNYNPLNGDLMSSGPVYIELNAEDENTPLTGLTDKQTIFLETSNVSYRHEGSLITTDQPVRFRIGASSGTARGMVYATRDGSLELEKEVAMELPPPNGHGSEPPMKLTAGRLRYEKLSRQIALWGPVRTTQGAREVSAGSGKVYLNEANRVTRVGLEESVKASESAEARHVEISADRAQGDFDPAAKALRHLSAEGNVEAHSQEKGSASRLRAGRVGLNLAGTPAKLQDGDAIQNVQLVIESPPTLGQGVQGVSRMGTEKKALSAAELQFSFRSDGKSLKDAQTVGPGKLVVDPSDPKSGQRIITSGQILMAFNAQSNLESLLGRKPTHIVFEPPKTAPSGSVAQESAADQLLASFDEADPRLERGQAIGKLHVPGRRSQCQFSGVSLSCGSAERDPDGAPRSMGRRIEGAL